MPSRRTFLANMLLSLGVLAAPPSIAAPKRTIFIGREKFKKIMARAKQGNWGALTIGELIGKIALEFEGTPYVGGTLEVSPDSEICKVDLTGLDCVTFFETTLDFARMIKTGGHTPADLLEQVSLTRYRGGKPGDYITRLHYTSDWFHDNESKGVIKILSQLPGAESFTQKVGFMSDHPASYPQLNAHPQLVAALKQKEEAINSRSMMFIPMDKIAAIEPLMQTGDIVGICTRAAGLDIAHTGLIYRDDAGMAHFMDASSKKNNMKVTIEPGPISQALSGSKDRTGIMLARPLEPNSVIDKSQAQP